MLATVPVFGKALFLSRSFDEIAHAGPGLNIIYAPLFII